MADSIPFSPALDEPSVSLTRRLEVITERLHAEVLRLGEMQATQDAQTELHSLRHELQGMGRMIADTRAEVAALLPNCIPHSRLSSASDELDGVVDATERAAVEIMTAAERAQESVQRLRALSGTGPDAQRDLDAIESATLDIFMACSFQDLTGQRIRKVVQALSYIEKRVLSLTSLWENAVGLHDVGPIAGDTRADAHLLNGPSDNGLGQDDIDLILHGPANTHAASQSDIDALFDDFPVTEAVSPGR